jgi:hypothetical protein
MFNLFIICLVSFYINYLNLLLINIYIIIVYWEIKSRILISYLINIYIIIILFLFLLIPLVILTIEFIGNTLLNKEYELRFNEWFYLSIIFFNCLNVH